MSNKIGFGSFFDFSDNAPINEAIAGITKLEKTYQGMIETVEDSNKRLAGDLIAVQHAADAILKSVKDLNVGMEKNQKVLAESAGSSEDLVKEYANLKTMQADNVKTIDTLQTQLTRLNTAKEKATATNKTESGSLNDLRNQLAAAEKEYRDLGDATDESIKDEQVQKVKALAYEYKNSDAALKEARKGVILAEGSYNQLNKEVVDAKKKLKDMEGGLEGSSQEFRDLQKFVTDGTVKLKAWDKEIGDHGREVGNYAIATKDLGGAFEKVGGGPINQVIVQVKDANKALLMLAANPVGLILLAIGAAIGALTAYFKGSIEGQDNFNKVLAVGTAILETLKDVAEAVGKAIFNAIAEPQKVWKDFMEFLSPFSAKLAAIWDSPGQAIKDFGKLIVENVINRFKAIGVAYEGLSKVFKGDFKNGLKDLANASLQAATGVEGLIDKISAAAQAAADKLLEIANKANGELQARIQLGLKIAALENQLRKDRIADILDDAQTELKVTNLLIESKDKLRFSDEQRYNKLREANKLLEDQLKGDLELAQNEIALQKLKIQQEGETYEMRQKLVELQAAEINQQIAFVNARKRRQQAEIALIREMEKEMIDSAKRIEDAEKAVQNMRLTDIVRTNQKILNEEMSSLEDRLSAIAAIDSAQAVLLQNDRDKQLDATKEAALARIELDSDTLETIYNNEKISIVERIAQERAAKEALLQTDKAYVDDVTRITEDFTNKTSALLDQSKKLAEDNVFKVLERDATILAAQTQAVVNNQLTALAEAYSAGELNGIQDYEKRKKDIQEKAQAESIQSQIDYLKTRSALMEQGSKERVEIEKNISALELALADANAKKREEIEMAVQTAVTNLKQSALQGALDIIASQNAAADADREARLQKLSDDEAKQLALVKDNEQAKAIIQQNFAAQKKKIDEEQKQANRKRAIFEKALAITEIAINTAKGISQALGAYPPPASFILAALVGALGAVQIATVAAKPIPAFADGTDNAPAGWALINEQGPELIMDKSGKPRIINSDGPTFAMMKGGERIIPADKTAQYLQYQDMVNGSGVLRAGIEVVQETAATNMKMVAEAILQGNGAVVSAIKSQPQDVYDEKGYRRYERTANGRVSRLDNKYKLG